MKKSLRTERMRQIRMSKKRERHELRKKRKVKSPLPFYNDGLDTQVAPHICAMFRKKRKKKTEKELKKQKQAYHDVVVARRAIKHDRQNPRMV